MILKEAKMKKWIEDDGSITIGLYYKIRKVTPSDIYILRKVLKNVDISLYNEEDQKLINDIYYNLFSAEVTLP